MSFTFGQFKSAIRGRIWPPGSAEPDNLVASHDKDFIDALFDLQASVVCLQQDNTDVFPQCSTTYNCGLTVLPCPRGIIKKLSVIDKIDSTTHLESADAADDYCGEVVYAEVDYCHVRSYLDRSRRSGCCHNIGSFFGLPFCGSRPRYPTPTDEGLAAGLPLLPLGFHYPQESTDREYGRAGRGVWAKERGNIYVAPWIQSTETILITWDGIKRSWNNGDPIDDDPLLSQAVEAYVRWQHARKWDKDEQAAADSMAEYNNTRSMLMRQCREETRMRQCEPSHARASTIGLATIYYNDDQSFTARCQSGQVGDPVSVTIQSGTVGSNVSVADANQKAMAQARAQAQAQLVCAAAPIVYASSQDWSYTASCAVEGVQEAAAPAPTGPGTTVTVKKGTKFTTATSQADADAQAQAMALAQATQGLKCTYSNAPQTATKACPDGTTGLVTITVAAGSRSITSAGTNDQASDQAAANALALTDAQQQALTEYQANAVTCPGSSAPPGALVYNSIPGFYSARGSCRAGGSIGSFIVVNYTVPIGTFKSDTLGNANIQARSKAQEMAIAIVGNKLAAVPNHGGCGATYNVTYPDWV